MIASRKPKKWAPASKQITSYFPNGHNGHNLQVHRFFGLTYWRFDIIKNNLYSCGAHYESTLWFACLRAHFLGLRLAITILNTFALTYRNFFELSKYQLIGFFSSNWLIFFFFFFFFWIEWLQKGENPIVGQGERMHGAKQRKWDESKPHLCFNA